MGAPSTGDAAEISFCAAKLGLSPSTVTLSTAPVVKMIKANIECVICFFIVVFVGLYSMGVKLRLRTERTLHFLAFIVH